MQHDIEAVAPVSTPLSFSSYRDAVASACDTQLDAHGVKPEWGWDYCLSFKIPHQLRVQLCSNALVLDQQAIQKSRQLVNRRVDILVRLKNAGFAFSQLLVPSEGLVLLRIGLGMKQMKEKAERMGIELKLKMEWGGGYLKYCEERDECFELPVWGPAVRMIVIMNTLQSLQCWGCAINIERLVYDGDVVQAFAIHSEERQQLVQNVVWKRIWDPTYVPNWQELRAYVGARVAFYFVFVSFYARNLLLVAILSLPVYVVYRIVDNVVVIAGMRWMFSIGVVLWTTVFLERWKRRNARVCLQWGVDDYKEDCIDDTRPQFRGDICKGFYCEGGFVSLADVDGDVPKVPFQDFREKNKLQMQSVLVTGGVVVLVGVLTFALLWFRNDVVQYFERRGWSIANAMPGVLNGVLVAVADGAWRSVSLWLTKRENCRTNQQFENSLVYKRFAFQFISNYVSLFFIAFVRPYLNRTCPVSEMTQKPDCMAELESQLTGLVITKATIGQITEIGIPFLQGTFKQWFARNKSKPKRTPTSVVPQHAMTSSGTNRYVLESKLPPYTSTLEDYGEMVLQFGYVALFGLAFPPAALVALLNNLIEGRTDAYKVLVLSQRVVADEAADIGAWYPILEFLNVLSVITNAGLVVFTADAAGVVWRFDERFPNDVWRRVLYRVVAFFVMEHVLLSVKATAAWLIPDVPNMLKRQAARQAYDVAKWFGEGWRDAFRGNSLLVVDDKELENCQRFADVFEVASEDEKSLR